MQKASKSKRLATIEREPQDLHRIPVIDKMMRVIEQVQDAPGAVGITQITGATRIPRSTVYRILNTLCSHGILTRTAESDYRLGFRLVALAASVDTVLKRDDIVRLTHPHLAALADTVGETCKLSMLDDGEAEVVDVVQSKNAMAPSSRIGSRFLLHAGAASKLLLAFAPPDVQKAVLKGQRVALTERTRVDRDALLADLEAVRTTQLSYDEGEWNANVHAVAAPVRAADGHVLAAVSVTYFASGVDSDLRQRIVGPLQACAEAMSSALGHYPGRRSP